MYNRYIPQDSFYAPVREEQDIPPVRENGGKQGGKEGMSGLPPLGKGSLPRLFQSRDGKGLTNLLKSLHLEDIDTGDVLLLLILLYLLVEGDDLELVIALGLVLLMGLGEKEKE